jgi:hypothetical protein
MAKFIHQNIQTNKIKFSPFNERRFKTELSESKFKKSKRELLPELKGVVN